MRHCFLTTLVLQIGVLTASLFGQEATPHDATFSIAPARVARRDQLFSEAQQLAAKGKHELAANKGEATLALEYELFGRQSAEATETLQWLATEYLQALEVHKAVERSRQYHALCRSVYGEDSWQAVAATYFEDFVRRMSKVTPQRWQ